jgi:hypothetical protein
VQGDPLVRRRGEPLADLRVLVGAVVVEHDVQVCAGVRSRDLLQERQELLVPVPGAAGIGGDLPGSHFERGEQRGGAVPLVVVGAARG